eukprot:Blabericola_migrator_1__36@NODE_100_length_14362_cov_139_136341_g85_i1_p4_GENE_NODE_100_length_14362_cov_139_136341_g85_i1NODE_100_length_14362_cov_139_136341_g85_i1_p4_ORF_typecomplete_len511_score75_87Sugar_tr/PF00083_24/8_5e44MFS_1/PF07690_16/6e02MFS_1/PF07690_16/6_7e17MFS_1/PF07690_16/4e09MFS_3/PF05977_13/0_00016MFS_3/PF05977_13/8_7e02MFS_3/PF05977_13/2_4_NODE_100_length_14362_cov_139_136341_g85_i168178349
MLGEGASSDGLESARSHEVSSMDIESAPVVMTMDEILERIGTHRMQWIVILISAFSYGHFSLQAMVPTLSVQSLKECWPHLKERPIVFNSVFAASAFARLVGSLCLLPLLDRFGRRNFLMAALCGSVLLSCAAAAAPEFYSYVVLRSLTLLITSVLPSAATIYSVELVRMRARSVPGTCCQFLGSIMVVYGTLVAGVLGAQSLNPNAWRWVTIVSCAPTVLPITGLAYVWVETPRFLLAVKHDVTKTWRALKRMSRGGEILKARLLEQNPLKSDLSVAEAVVVEGMDDSKPTAKVSIWKEIKATMIGTWSLLKQRERAVLTYTLALTWALQSFSHWGLSAYMTVFYSFIGVNVTWTTAASFFVQLPGHLVLYYLMESRLGRVGSIKAHATLCSLMHLLLSIVLAVGVTNQGLLMTLAMLCFFFGGPLWGAIYTYSAEMYPTTLRSSAMALFSATNAVAAIVTTYIGSVSLDANRTWSYPLIWGLLRLGILFCAFFWKKETVRATLEDHDE